jgi:hypothetical protein
MDFGMLDVDNLVFIFLPPLCFTSSENNKQRDLEENNKGEYEISAVQRLSFQNLNCHPK